MAFGAAALLAMPLLRTQRAGVARDAHALEVYRQQLAELEGERFRGVIAEPDAAAARLEIERRMLRILDAAEAAKNVVLSAAPKGFWARRGRQLGALGLSVLAPAAAFAVYFAVGNPEQAPNRDLSRVAGADPEHMDMAALTQKLAEKLAKSPEDIQGWMLLGRSYVTLGDFPKAIEAYGKAVTLTGGKPAPMVLAEYAEALVQGNNGLVGEDAQAEFRKVLQILPGEPRSQFYLGLAKAQAGDAKGALADWVALLKQAEPGASWAGAVREQAQEIAGLLKVDLATLLPAVTAPSTPAAAPPPAPTVGQAGPDASAVAAAAAMPAAERTEMIEGMVARLAARLENEEKDNVDGWLKLAGAYRVLGRKEDALAALGRAVEAGPGRMDALSAYGEALQASGETQPVTDRFAGAMQRILALEPGNNQALWFMGAYAVQKGDTPGARSYWERLRSSLPPESEEYRSVSAALDKLGKS